jgi:hypothetical protein
MPARAASAHWVFRCSVSATTVIRSITRRESSSAATVSAKVVLPAPGSHREEVAGVLGEVPLHRAGLPGTQLRGGAPGGAVGVGGG